MDAQTGKQATPQPGPQPGAQPGAQGDRKSILLEREIASLRRWLIREATLAVELLEMSLRALWTLDTEAAREVRRGEDRVDAEEVAIERECLRLMTLLHPFGTDFRSIAFCLKVNADIERISDHAASIAKVCLKLAEQGDPPPWPTALTELAARVPMRCHELLRAVLDNDHEAARNFVRSDDVIDRLDHQLFDEVVAYLERPNASQEAGLLIYRVSRELERVGDLTANIAEDVVYLVTGKIIRHEGKPGRPDRQS